MVVTGSVLYDGNGEGYGAVCMVYIDEPTHDNPVVLALRVCIGGP